MAEVTNIPVTQDPVFPIHSLRSFLGSWAVRYQKIFQAVPSSTAISLKTLAESLNEKHKDFAVGKAEEDAERMKYT